MQLIYLLGSTQPTNCHLTPTLSCKEREPAALSVHLALAPCGRGQNFKLSTGET